MKRKRQIRYITTLAILMAITIIFAFVSIPIIPGSLEITITIIPVAFGAIILGPIGGLVLGFTFGMVSFLQTFGFSALGAILLGINPGFAFLVCVPTRALAGLLVGLIYKAFRVKEQKGKRYILAHIVTNLGSAFLNTVFFMTMFCLCYYYTPFVQDLAASIGAVNPFIFVVFFVGFNALLEVVMAGTFGSLFSINLLPVIQKKLQFN